MLAGLGVCCSESCKDVDVVSVAPQCLTSTAVESLAMGMGSEHILKDQPFYNSRIKFQDDSSLDYDSGLNNITVPSSVFEFQRADRGLQRAGLAPFFKAPPSKWDDAQKWIASPTTNQNTNRQLHIEGGVGLRKNNQFGYGSRQTSMKVVLEIPDQMLVTYGEPDIKRMELSQEFKEAGWRKPVEWEGNSYQSTDSHNNTVVTTENFAKQSSSKTSGTDFSVPRLRESNLLLVLEIFFVNNGIELIKWPNINLSSSICKIAYSYCGRVSCLTVEL